MPSESIYIAGPSVRNDPRVQTPILPLVGRGLRLTRVRGVPRAGEALRFGDLVAVISCCWMSLSVVILNLTMPRMERVEVPKRLGTGRD